MRNGGQIKLNPIAKRKRCPCAWAFLCFANGGFAYFGPQKPYFPKSSLSRGLSAILHDAGCSSYAHRSAQAAADQRGVGVSRLGAADTDDAGPERAYRSPRKPASGPMHVHDMRGQGRSQTVVQLSTGRSGVTLDQILALSHHSHDSIIL